LPNSPNGIHEPACPDRRFPNLPALIAAAGDQATLRFLEFIAAIIRNPHARRAYTAAP
jgi:hypothetical protein